MSDQNQDGASGSPSRRSVLAALSSVTTVGLAGCSGDGNGTETPTPSGGDTTETPTPSGSTETPTSSGVNCDDGAEKADIPGEVVHNGIDSINILSHTACRGALWGIRVRVENTGGQVLIPARDVATSEHEFFAAARVLTSEGNLIEIAHLLGEAAEINPGTEATLFQGFSQELGKYELCISFENTEVYGKDWQEVCGG